MPKYYTKDRTNRVYDENSELQLDKDFDKWFKRQLARQKKEIDGKWYDALIEIHQERPTEYSGIVTNILRRMKMGKFRPSN